MPKKKVNAFFLYMRDYMIKEQKKGRTLNMAQAQNEAGKLWVKVGEREKSVYTQKARNENCASKEEVKLTSQGVPVSYIEKEKVEKDNEERLMKKDIEDTVKTNFIQATLDSQNFYFIMVNYFTKNVEENIYIPAEIAVSEYSIKDGVTKKFHSFINPVVEMFGHAYEAKVHSELTHKLPLPPNALGEKNLERLYLQILKFIQGGLAGSNLQNCPPLYTHKESIPIVKSVLSYLQNDINELSTTDLKVYPMHYLFFTLKKTSAEIGENPKPASIHVTDAILDRDQYEYERDISCDFHEQNDNGKYCALSCVVRWTYIFSENLCNDMAIRMIPGRHCPPSTIQVMPIENASASTLSIYDESIESKSSLSLAGFNYEKMKLNPRDIVPSSSASVFSEDYPILGSRKTKKKFSTKSTDDENDTDCTTTTGAAADNDDDDEDNNKKKKYINPWAVRSNVNVKPPADSSFSFSSVAIGQGRGIMRSESSTPLRGQGRGRFFMNQN